MSASREDFAAERADFARLLASIRKIQHAPAEALDSIDWLAQVIREAGLVAIPNAEEAYGEEAEFLTASQQGVVQLPREFARYLHVIGQFRPATYLEIGCFNGATASLATAYLQRLNPALQATSIDLWPGFLFHEEVRSLLPMLRYEVGKTSFHFRAQVFEAVFIDGDHSFEWAWADYQNVGRAARVCALHDICNAPYRDLLLGGVCGAWEMIQQQESGPGIEFGEISEHPEGTSFGIGLRMQRE